jgi:hypothetical protein
MTQTEALQMCLEYIETDAHERKYVRHAIKAALEAKDEPVKLRRGDILRCIETDELCIVWATSTSGKTLIKWKGNDFTDYTAEQIGELFWLEPKEKDEPWEKFCDSNCVWTDHHPDCKLAQRTWVGLTDEEYLEAESVVWITINLDSDEKEANRDFYQAIEAKLKEKNNA